MGSFGFSKKYNYLNNYVILTTGASSGIGEVPVHKFYKAGYTKYGGVKRLEKTVE